MKKKKWIPLPPETFDIPVHEIRRGYRTDVYFWRSKIVMEKAGINDRVLMQVFQKKGGLLCGVDEILAILRLCSGYYSDLEEAYQIFDEYIKVKQHIRTVYGTDEKEWINARKQRLELESQLDALWVKTGHKLEIRTLKDGDAIEPYETVMTIEGPLYQFVHLETIYLGVLARRTKIATNVYEVAQVANGKSIFFFPARFDHWTVQGGDGYAASIGGASLVSTDAQGAWWGSTGAGTTPHALIAACLGDTVRASELVNKFYPDTPLITLVDFHNDSVKTSLEVARAMGDKLWGVRLDTSESCVDKSVNSVMTPFPITGVNPQLVEIVRQALDREGFQNVKIIVSGGFNKERIRAFEKSNVPVDAYGIGSAFLEGQIDFTADVVKVNGEPMVKAGRYYNENARLTTVEYL